MSSLAMVVLGLTLAGCGSSSASPKPTGTPVPTTNVTSGSAQGVHYSSISFFGKHDGLVAQPIPGGTRLLSTKNGGFSWHGVTTNLRITSLQMRGPHLAFGNAISSSCPAVTSGATGSSPKCTTGIVRLINGGAHQAWALKLKAPHAVVSFGFKRGGVGWAIVATSSCLPAPTVSLAKNARCPSPLYNETLATTNGGITWHRILPKAGQVIAVSLANPHTGWVLTAPPAISALSGSGTACRSSLLETTTAGSSWRLRTRFKNLCQGFLSFTSPTTGFALMFRCSLGYCAHESLMRTLDAGRTWSTIASGAGLFMNKRGVPTGLDFLNRQIGWISTAGRLPPGGVLITRNGGISWSAHLRTTSVDSSIVTFVNAHDAWAIKTLPKAGDRIVHSPNGGRKWHLVVLPYSHALVPGHPIAVVVSYHSPAQSLNHLSSGPIWVSRRIKVRSYEAQLNMLPAWTKKERRKCTPAGGPAFTFGLRFVYHHHPDVHLTVRSPGCGSIYAQTTSGPRYVVPPGLVNKQLIRVLPKKKPGHT